MLKNKWVFYLKHEENNSHPRYKAQLDVKKFGKKKGLEIFSQVMKMLSIRIVLGMAASIDLKVEQLDIKTAFLHGNLEEEICMRQPKSFEVKVKKTLCINSRKVFMALSKLFDYGTRSSIHLW